jgi:hypothetical protein
MDTFWAIVLIGGVIFYFLNKAGNAKVAKQQRQARLARQDAESKASAKKKASVKAKPVTKAPAKKSVAKATSKKAASSGSKSRAPGWKPTYDGPMFAQPGEKSALFSYASFVGMHELDAPFSLIDFETSGFHPGSARILEVAVIKIDAQGQTLKGEKEGSSAAASSTADYTATFKMSDNEYVKKIMINLKDGKLMLSSDANPTEGAVLKPSNTADVFTTSIQGYDADIIFSRAAGKVSSIKLSVAGGQVVLTGEKEQ